MTTRLLFLAYSLSYTTHCFQGPRSLQWLQMRIDESTSLHCICPNLHMAGNLYHKVLLSLIASSIFLPVCFSLLFNLQTCCNKAQHHSHRANHILKKVHFLCKSSALHLHHKEYEHICVPYKMTVSNPLLFYIFPLVRLFSSV